MPDNPHAVESSPWEPYTTLKTMSAWMVVTPGWLSSTLSNARAFSTNLEGLSSAKSSVLNKSRTLPSGDDLALHANMETLKASLKYRRLPRRISSKKAGRYTTCNTEFWYFCRLPQKSAEEKATRILKSMREGMGPAMVEFQSP